jgi:DNA-binding NarL/FixJ family response regulator
MPTKYHFAVVDDHPMILNGLIAYLKPATFVATINGFLNVSDFKNWLHYNPIDIAILDLRIHNQDGGLELATLIKKEFPQTKILVYTAHLNSSYIMDCIGIGVHAYICKDSPVHEIKNAISAFKKDEIYYSEDVAKLIKQQRKLYVSGLPNEDLLSKREIEILRMICKGLNAEQIGASLFISKNTARKHRQNIMSKTDCHNVQELWQYASANRLLSEKY